MLFGQEKLMEVLYYMKEVLINYNQMSNKRCNWNTNVLHIQTSLPEAHSRTVRFLAWAPSGNKFASSSFDSTVNIWDNSEVRSLFWLEIGPLKSYFDWKFGSLKLHCQYLG